MGSTIQTVSCWKIGHGHVKAKVFNSKKSEGHITLKGRKERSIYQRKRDRRRIDEGRKGGREKLKR